jgi:hypothetical protein
MADISLSQLVLAMAERAPDPSRVPALLALTLDALDLPTQDTYTPPQVLAIGTHLLQVEAGALAAVKPPAGDTKLMWETTGALASLLLEASQDLATDGGVRKGEPR